MFQFAALAIRRSEKDLMRAGAGAGPVCRLALTRFGVVPIARKGERADAGWWMDISLAD